MDYSDLTDADKLELALDTDNLYTIFGLLVKRLAASSPKIAGMYQRFLEETAGEKSQDFYGKKEYEYFRLLIADIVRVLSGGQPRRFMPKATTGSAQEIFYPIAVLLTDPPPFIEETAASQVNRQAAAQYIYLPD